PGAPPDRPPSGTVYRSARPVTDLPGGAPFRLPALRVGWHSASPQALSRLRLFGTHSGLILGVDRHRQPVAVPIFGSQPTRVTLVGGAWAARLLVLRSLALGVSAVVLSAEPAVWHGLGEMATGQADRVVVLGGEQPLHAFATSWQPALVTYD